MVDLFLKGGPLMIPLLLGSILMFAIIFERIVVFSSTGVRPSFIDAMKRDISASSFKESNPGILEAKGPVQKLLVDIMDMKQSPIDTIEKNISLKGDMYLHHLEKRLPLLELIGRMAPMVGLLGTVMGMVEAFRQVAAVKTVVDPSILAGGIWQALVTTVFGLIVGIPSLIAHHLFITRLERTAFLMKHYSEEIISLIKAAHD
ncbi:MAG: MotA/TolQ/ExbB proton channel family protein [Spirochaetales bacterium]|nr:MotA/TolQ/ExbB proton channel family protein [Spirochaetales bacterium]